MVLRFSGMANFKGQIPSFQHHRDLQQTFRILPVQLIWSVFAYTLPASEQVYQSAVLRHGAMHWMRRVLAVSGNGWT